MTATTLNYTDAKQARDLIGKALAAGLSVSVHDGEAWALKRSTDAAAILAALGSTDADSLRFRDAAGENVGFAYLVYGNGPDELVADCSAEGVVARLCGFGG